MLCNVILDLDDNKYRHSLTLAYFYFTENFIKEKCETFYLSMVDTPHSPPFSPHTDGRRCSFQNTGVAYKHFTVYEFYRGDKVSFIHTKLGRT